MNNVLAAQVLRSHVDDITDSAYKRATEIAIEVLYEDAQAEYITGLYDRDGTGTVHTTLLEYLGLSDEEYAYWILGKRDPGNK